MRNLKNIFLEETSTPENLHLSANAWDAADDSIICAFGPTESSPTIILRRKRRNDTALESGFESIASWDAPCPLPDLPSDQIVGLQYFSDSATSCLILAGGDLVVVREDPQHEEEKIEIVGSVDTGIAAAAWAPDEELLAIVTRTDTLILMTRYFEPVTDVTLTAEDLKASKHVSVGWGKKETQFQGKRAKALRDPTMPESVDEGKLSPFDTGRTSVSWRGDGAFLAVNRVVPNGRRVIRIFTREGAIDSASEPLDGLESALSWRPAGNLLAGVQRLADRLDVVFFERNGLRHGEFSLRLSKDEMETWASDASLAWNIDSTVLAVSFRDRIQLWTMGNYHYYLKQEVLFTGGTLGSSLSITWHPEKPLRMCVESGGTILDTEYLFCVDKGSTIRPHDNGTVAVVDGRSIKLTPLKHAMVPPPMSFSEITTSENVIGCSTSLTGSRVVVLTAMSMEVYLCDFRSKPATAPRRIASWSFASQGEFCSDTRFTQILIQNEDRIRLLSHSKSDGSKISSYNVDDSRETLIDAGIDVNTTGGDRSGYPRRMYTDANHEFLWWQARTGLICLNQSDLSSPSAVHSYSEILVLGSDGEYANEIDDYSHQSNDQVRKRAHIFSLSRKGELFANDKLLTRGCTSFVSTNSHLIFTTAQHLLKFIHIDASDVYEVPGDTLEADERCRSIERGAKLVTVIPSIYAVVLQMPRGNLETIYPRALVLAGIRQHLHERDFKSAFLACQNHQVDMNIIHDYSPNLFMSSVSLFIEQVKKVSRIDLFLSKLSEDDASKTIYKDTLAKRGADDVDGGRSNYHSNGASKVAASHVARDGKVNRICEAFLSCLPPKVSKYLQNIITAHVSKRPPDFVSALELVASLRKSDANKAEEAVSHLCFLSDVNRLYETALSLYDLPLTLLVAQQAQRDPREYMPFLQSLNALPQHRRNFRIDDHLRNYPKALTSLHALSSHEEIEAYTIKHALYPQALKLYRYDTEHLTNITRLHATYLTSQSNHLASAISSESLSDYALACSSYAKCSPPRWREALHCATMIQPSLPTEQIQSLALQLATTLVGEQRDYRSASQIHIDYLHDISTAARLLCRGSYFAESLRLLSLHALTPSIPDLIDTALAEKSGEITELIADCRSQLLAQVPRIKELRVKKSEDPLGFFGGDPAITGDGTGGEGGVDIPDNISLAPTDASTMGGQSLFTRYTGPNKSKFAGTVATGNTHVSRQTSRTRRREERKRARGKKGSVYEEEYLVGSVKRLVERVNEVHGEVGRLVEGLRRRGMGERVEMVEGVMRGIIRECGRAVGEVWGEGEGEGREGGRGGEVGGKGEGEGDEDEVGGIGSRPRGADGVFWDSQMETQTQQAGRKEAPEVKVWKGSEQGSY